MVAVAERAVLPVELIYHKFLFFVCLDLSLSGCFSAPNTPANIVRITAGLQMSKQEPQQEDIFLRQPVFHMEIN